MKTSGCSVTALTKEEIRARCFELCASITRLHEDSKHHSGPWTFLPGRIKELTELLTRAAIEAEREACAKTALAVSAWREPHASDPNNTSAEGHRERMNETEQVVAAIRARGEGD